MPNYPLPFTAEEIQGYLNKVATPDGSPVSGSQALITSGAVKSALTEIELLGGGGGINNLTKEDIEGLGITVNLEQIGDLDNLTLDFSDITGDVTVNAEDITDVENIFINASQIADGTISADRIGNISLENVDTIENLTIDSSQINNLTIDAEDVSNLENTIESVAGDLTIDIEQLESITDWSIVGDNLFSSDNTALSNVITSVAGDLAIDVEQLSAITNYNQINGDFTDSVNLAISNAVGDVTGNLSTSIQTALAETDVGTIGGTFATTLNTLLEQNVVTLEGDSTIDIGRVDNITDIESLGGSFNTAVNEAISNAITNNNGEFTLTTANVTGSLTIDDFHSDFADSINTAIGTYITSNVSDLSITVSDVTADFDLTSLSDLGDWNDFINTAIANSITVQNGDIYISTENITSNLTLNLDNLPDGVGTLVDGLIENNAVKIDITHLDGAFNFLSDESITPTQAQEDAFSDFITTIEGNVTIDVGSLTGTLDITSNEAVTINANVMTGALPDTLDFSNVTINANSAQLTNLDQAVAALGVIQINDVDGVDTIDLSNLNVTGLDVSGSDVSGFTALEDAVAAINFSSIMGDTVSFTDVSVTGLQATAIDNFADSVTAAVGALTLNDISATGSIDFSGATVSGINLAIDDVTGLQTALDNVTATATFENLTGEELDLSNVTVTGLNISSIDDGIDSSDVASAIADIVIDKTKIDFIDDDGNIQIGSNVDQVNFADGAISISSINNITQEIGDIVADLSLDYLPTSTDDDGNVTVDLSNANVTGLNFDLSALGNQISTGTGTVALPSTLTIAANNVTGTLTASQMGISQGNLDILGADLGFLNVSDSTITVDASTVSGTLNLGDLEYDGQIPIANVAGINISIDDLSASDFETIAQTVQGDLNVSIENISGSEVLFDIEEVDGNVEYHTKASSLSGDIPAECTYGGNTFSGLPAGVSYYKLQIVQDGNMIEKWFATWSASPA